MIPIGDRPILWHIMKYYASFGYRDFILCLGYKAEVIKEYFLDYNEALANDFVLRDGGRRIELLSTRHPRLVDHLRRHRPAVDDRPAPAAVEPHLGDDEIFLANYGDTLTDAPLPDMVETLRASDNDRALPRLAADLQLPRRHVRRDEQRASSMRT